MKVTGFSAVILWTQRIDETLRFYQALGLPLVEEDHGEGPIHYACYIAGVHFAIFPGEIGEAVSRRSGGCTQVGFNVSDVDAAFATAKELGAKVVWEPRDMPWGRAALVRDPDGRPVELNHTPQ